MEYINFRFDTEIYNRLKDIAETEKVSVCDKVRTLISDFNKSDIDFIKVHSRDTVMINNVSVSPEIKEKIKNLAQEYKVSETVLYNSIVNDYFQNI